MSFMVRVGDCLRLHHELSDGIGYPFGCYGRSIPIEAQMLCVASEYVAMTAPRLYRASLFQSQAQAGRYLRSQIGRRYSLYVVALFFCAKASQDAQVTLTALMRRLKTHFPPAPLPRRVL